MPLLESFAAGVALVHGKLSASGNWKNAGEMSVCRIHVHEVQQWAGGGSYVCIFDADMAIAAGSTTVEVRGVEPVGAAEDLVQLAADWMRASAIEVLDGTGLAATIRVRRLVVNETDWKESRFKLYMAREVRRILAMNR